MKLSKNSKKPKKNTIKPKLSVVINTKNVATTLEKTLRSAQFADEIVIVDAHSTDETIEIAKQYTDRIFFMKGPNYVEPYRNLALSKAQYPWVFVLDADEQISTELRAALNEIMHSKTPADAYYVPRKNYIFGKWILHTGWWPDYQLRFFRNGAVQWQDTIHSIPKVSGQTVRLPAEEQYALSHDNYTSVSQFLGKLNLYTTIQAQEKLQEKTPESFSVKELLDIFAGEFSRRAFALNGAKDGIHGIALSLLQGLSEASVYLKQWEGKKFPQQNAEDLGAALASLRQIMAYWHADYKVRQTRGLAQLYWRIRRKLKR